MTGDRRNRFIAVYLVLGANLVLLLVLMATLGYVQTLRGQVAESTSQSRTACARGNLRSAAINWNGSTLQAFLSLAARTREETAEHADDAGDPVTANINRDAARAYRDLAKGFTPLLLVDCQAIYP